MVFSVVAASCIIQKAGTTFETSTCASLPSLTELTLGGLPQYWIPNIIIRLAHALRLRRERGQACIQKLVLAKCGPIAQEALHQLKEGNGVEDLICID